MKKTFGTLAFTLIAVLFSTTFISAQNNYRDRSYDIDDRIVIVNDYGNDYRNDRGDAYRGKRKRNKRASIRQQRQRNARILQRAYAIAEADGRVTRRERRELRNLEVDLGIYRNGRDYICGSRGNGNRRGHRGH
ncbi:hypothetical protein N9B82_00750 [Saprospiraceae bacterium]|nr:hypothetical protein [Saprospiraceae bacterium]